MSSVVAAACGLAPELGSSSAAVEAHVDRMPAAYVESVSPRAIVRHTLLTATPLGDTEVRTRVTPGATDPALLAALGSAGDVAEEGTTAGDLDELDVVAIDAPGWFAKVAGVIALQGGSVLAAEAFSRDDGLLVDTFTVRRPDGATGSWWARVEGDLVDAGIGRLAVRARVARQARAEEPRISRLAPVPTSVTVAPDGDAAVVEVRTTDRIGVLHAIASAMAELELDVVDARVQTRGREAHDRFRVRDRVGAVPDEDHRAELVLAVTDALDSLGVARGAPMPTGGTAPATV